MTDAQMYAAIIGFFLPLVMSVIIQTGWDKRAQAVLLFVVVLIVSVGTLYFTGQLEGRSLVSSVLLTFVTSIAAYHGLWKPTQVAPAIESATNFSSSPDNTIV
jgi:VIT1/CCC1 family predicted Fe2+/Mn2+ transporter